MNEVTAAIEQTHKDLVIPGACALCGGDLSVRITPAGARSCCIPCRWISIPQVRRQGDDIVMTHAASGLA